MSNSLTSTGLTTKTRSEIVADLTTALKALYGIDINLDPSTPDGQLLNIIAQAAVDNLDLLTQIYNSFNPDTAVGTTLDQRVAFNGIQRLQGTRTKTNVTIVTTQACTLYGSDQFSFPIYTVADNAGNQWQLVTSVNVPGAGTYVYEFESVEIGAFLTVPNTITIPVTIVLGVDTINNPTTYTTLGINEETDAALRLRRLKSVSISSQGFLSTLLAALLNVNGVTSANVYENNTDAVDGFGVPGHSIWVVVDGTALAADIANAIYGKRNAGCGMFGTQEYTITQLDGSPFTVRWDNVEEEDLYIQFTATPIDPAFPVNTAAILAGLPGLFIPGVYETVNINDLATLVQQIDNNCLVTLAGFSLSGGGPFTNTLAPSSKFKKFKVTSGNINIL